MANPFQAGIKRILKVADAATNPDAKGKAFEDLACYLFEKIPGISVIARNVLDHFESEEIDLALSNEQHPRGLKAFDPWFLIECKNWSKPVSSAEVATFISKVENRSLRFGILIAANGITGTVDEGNRAHAHIAIALVRSIRVIVITRAEIESLMNTEDFVVLIKRKFGQLLAGRTIWP
jgi:Restriction endonuclease